MKTIFEMKAREYANSTENTGSCPRDVKDAGKYAGYLAGAMYAIKSLSEIGIEGANQYWLSPEEFDTETGTWLGCEVKTSPPVDALVPFDHVIEHAPVAAQLVVKDNEILQLKQELDAKNQNGCCIVEHGYCMAAEHKIQQLEADNQKLRDFLEGLNEMYPDFIEKTLVVEDREGFFELLNKEKAGE